ncbi:MAG: Two component transcriptional regulator, winged helix family protein [Parcubacteria group bacterium GW2011_GWA2_44_12]|nr:MAG: Two component transcriptional regulator, winged helix family protein [Parcubacteria group bacterium GW2011_GWA2_44_12]
MDKPKKILIVEDEKSLADMLALSLKISGFEVKNAYNGDEAIEILKNEIFDLVMLDLVMPKKDGFTVLADMNATKIKTPVIVSSNLFQGEDVKRAKELGARDFFIKSNTAITDVVDYIATSLKNKKGKP